MRILVLTLALLLGLLAPVMAVQVAPTIISGTVVVKDATGIILTIPIVKTTGEPYTGLTAAGMAAKRCRPNVNGACVADTLTASCTLGTFTSGCFLARDSAGAVYEYHAPNAAFVTGVDRGVITITGPADSVPTIIPYELVSVGLQNVATTLGTPVGASVSADIAAVQTDTTAMLGGYYRKNVAGQLKIPVYLFVTATGAPYTGASTTVSVNENKDDGGWAEVCAAPCATLTGGGASGNGLFWYAPAQADTNCDHCGFLLSATGANGRYSIRTAP